MQIGKFLDSEISPPRHFKEMFTALHKKYSIIFTAAFKVNKTLLHRVT